MSSTTVKVNLVESGRAPEKKHAADACYDCYARTPVTIRPGQRVKVPLGFRMSMEPGWEAVIRSRSGLSYTSGIAMANGVGTIDAGYRDEVCAIVVNLDSVKPFEIKRGDRVCQIGIREVPSVELELVEDFDVSDSDRGTGGFGSTGV